MTPYGVKESLGRSQRFAYALPVVSVSFLMGPLAILQGIYAKHFGLALSTIATVLLISRLFDAVSDPLIGYFSDRYHGHTGSRKPLIIGGGVLLLVASYFLYVPPADVSTIYFLSWFLILIFAFTLFEIPHLAWASDISGDSKEKNEIYGWRALFMFLGTMIFFAVPLTPMFETNEFTPQTLHYSVLVIGCLIAPMLYICMSNVPDGRGKTSSNAAMKNYRKSERLGQLLSSMLSNQPLLWFLCAFLFVGVGTGMWFTLLFLFVDSFLDLGEYLAWMYVVSYGVGALTLRGWTWLANRFNKQKAWGMAMAVIAIGVMGSGMLSPNETGLFTLIFFVALVYAGFAAWVTLAPSLLADIVDYSIWKFGHDRAGTYFSLYTLVSKINWSIGGALALGLAGWYGFDVTSTAQSTEAVFGLRLTMVWLPVPMVLLSIFSMSRVSINARRQGIVRRRLDNLTARLESSTHNYKNLNHSPKLISAEESLKGTL